VDLQGLVANPPGTHVSKTTGNPLPWQIAARVLEIIDASVGAESRTLETGAGVSTALFALKGCEHTCVVPWTSERDRLQAWGSQQACRSSASRSSASRRSRYCRGSSPTRSTSS
jgi:hypothetical protein